jgi:UDP-N-acetylglucosamine acyltransferase
MKIHSSAIIDKEVQLAPNCEVGPFSIIRGRTKVGAGTKIENNVIIGSEVGVVEIGENNHFFAGAAVGLPPQDLSFKGEETKLVVGDNNTFREYVTINLGTVKGGGTTRIGNNNLLMAYCHVGHDTEIANNVVIANSVQLAGHVKLEDYVRIGGLSAVAQFARVGKHCYIGGLSAPNKDVLPFTIAQGIYAKSRATNKIGLERAGFTTDEINNINRAVRYMIMGDRTAAESLQKIKEECEQDQHIQYVIQFIESSQLGIAK